MHNLQFKEYELEDVVLNMKDGVKTKQNKSFNGDKIVRIESLSNRGINTSRVGYANLTDKQKKLYQLKKNDIVFSYLNSIKKLGTTGIVSNETELFLGANLFLIRPNDKVDHNYLNYFLEHLKDSGYWNKKAKHALNYSRVNQSDIKKVKIPIPSLIVQNDIVENLNLSTKTIREQIKNLQIKTLYLENLKHSLIASEFSQFENNKKYEMNQFAEIYTGITYRKEDISNTGVPILSPKNIKDYKLDISKLIKINKPIPKKYILENNDILMKNRSGSLKTLGETTIISDVDSDISFGNFLTIFKTEYFEYLNYYFLTPDFRKMVNSGQSSSVSQITINSLKTKKIPMPSNTQIKNLCSSLNEKVKAIDQLSKNNSKVLALYQNLYKTNLDKYFTNL